MASISKREDRPNTPYQVRYRTPDGKSRRKQFRRRVDAERFAATTEADQVRGAWTDPALGRLTFAAWCERWEAGLVGLRDSTKALNLGVLHKHLLPRFGSRQLASITLTDVKAMVGDDLAGGASGSATRRHVIVLRSILEAARLEGRIGRNPCKGVKLPPESSRPMRFLEPAQVVAVADAIRPVHYRPLIFTAAYVGLRWGELAGLRVERVDVLRRRIRVEEQLTEVGGRLAFGPPKTRSGSRTVTMPATIAQMLGEHMSSEPVRTSGMVFPTETGKLMRRNNFRTRWRRAVNGRPDRGEAGVFTGTELSGLVFHELRHTAAALAIAQGAHPLAIRDRLGHSSITVTMDTYGGLFPGLDETIAEGLEGMLAESLVSQACPSGVPATHIRRSAASHP